MSNLCNKVCHTMLTIHIHNIHGTVLTFTVEEPCEKDCPICLSGISDPVWLGCCDKIFCRKCIAEWTLCGKTCPMCCNVIHKELYGKLLPPRRTKRPRIPTDRYKPI